MHLKVDQRTGQLSLPHVGEKIERNGNETKTDEQISLLHGLAPWDQSDRQKQTKVEDKIFWKVKQWKSDSSVEQLLNRHIQMKLTES